ncbi:MAG: pilus assembly protein PilM [Myxococcota bacterium]
MAQRIVGLDVGSWSVKAMVLESSLRKMSFVGFREHHLPVDANGQALPDELAAAVKATIGDLDVDIVSTAVPGVQVLTREVRLPFSDAKRIAPVLGFQLESLLPRPIETVVYDWHVLKKDAEGATLLCPAADKAWLQGWLSELKAGGAEPRYVTLTSLALGQLGAHLSMDAGDRPWAIIDMGHRSTQITLVRQGRVEAFRTLARGGHHVTQAIARALGVSYADAEHAKHSQVSLVGDEAHSPLARAAGQALEPLFRDIKLTIDAFAERDVGRIAEVLLMGGGARLPGIEPLLAKMLDMPTSTPHLAGAIWDEVRRNATVPEIGLAAAALALEHVAEGDHRVNFQRGGGGFGDLGALRAKAGWIAAFLAVALVLFFVRKQIRIGTLKDQQTQLVARLDEHAKKVLDETIPAGKEGVDRFKYMQALVTAPPESEIEQVYPGATAFRSFYDMTKVLGTLNAAAAPPEPEPLEPGDDPDPDPPAPVEAPADRKQIELQSVMFDLKTGTITGIGYDIGTIEGFASKLRQNPCFKKVDLKDTKKTTRNPVRASWLDFTLKLEIKCDPKLGAPATATASAGTPASDKADKLDKPEGGDKLPSGDKATTPKPAVPVKPTTEGK